MLPGITEVNDKTYRHHGQTWPNTYSAPGDRITYFRYRFQFRNPL